MDKISTCRAAYLIPFIEVLRDIGAPVTRELAKAKLPTMIEEMPEDLISNTLALEFLSENEKCQGIDDLGWLWAKQFSYSTFSAELQASLQPMSTVKARLDRFACLSKLEDSDVSIGVIKSDGRAEVFCDAVAPDGLNGIHISEWTQVMVLIDLVRSITGKNWSPDEIRFKSDFSVCDEAREANPNTRFRKRSARTSIIMPLSVLAASKITCGAAQAPDQVIPIELDGVGNLKRLIRPYLRAVAPKIEVLAEITGTSPRTLQRQLRNHGVNLRQLIETTRFEVASEMLREQEITLVDVAMTLGYENQSNFGRSFRRYAGISPGRYRREVTCRECTA